MLTDEEYALLPSDDDVGFYAEHGWYLSQKLFTDDEVDELVAASLRYYAGERDRTLPVRPPKLAYTATCSGTTITSTTSTTAWPRSSASR
jgi:hypothetical protein